MNMSGWQSGYSSEVIASAMFYQLDHEFESHPLDFLIFYQNFEKLSSKIGVSSNLVWAKKNSYPTISADSAALDYLFQMINRLCLMSNIMNLIIESNFHTYVNFKFF